VDVVQNNIVTEFCCYTELFTVVHAPRMQGIVLFVMEATFRTWHVNAIMNGVEV
jgi:hypothetical protein